MTTNQPTPVPNPVQAEVAEDIKTLLEEAIRGTSKEIKGGTAALTLYVAERTAVLSTLVGQRGFERAVIAERDNIALRSAIELGRQASGADQRIIGIIQSVLLMGAKRLAAAALL